MAGNPLLNRLAADGKNPHGRKSEKRVAKQMGARLHPNSGAMRGAKSDASLKESNFRLECKSTVNDSIALECRWLAKIAKEALSHGQRPAVTISFVDAEGKNRFQQYSEWVCLPMSVFQELTE